MSAALRQIAPQGDPTNTERLRANYATRLRGPFGTLNAVIREGVQSNDAFNLRPETDVLQERPSPPPNFGIARDEEKIALFTAWLEEQEERGILETIHQDENPFVRQAYSRSVQDADRALNAQSVQVSTEDLEGLFNTPVHRRTLQDLFTKNFTDLEGITEAMNRQISEELTAGFAQGENPTKIARRITDRVNKIGKTRATTLAQTNVIEAYSDGHLNRFEQIGITRVTVQAEWLTAGDEKVCPICAALEGQTWTTERVRSGTFHFEPGENDPDHLEGDYPIKPPSHARCRCRLLPSVS